MSPKQCVLAILVMMVDNRRQQRRNRLLYPLRMCAGKNDATHPISKLLLNLSTSKTNFVKLALKIDDMRCSYLPATSSNRTTFIWKLMSAGLALDRNIVPWRAIHSVRILILLSDYWYHRWCTFLAYVPLHGNSPFLLFLSVKFVVPQTTSGVLTTVLLVTELCMRQPRELNTL